MKALENLSDRITVHYNNKPSYDIVYSESFDGIVDELKNMNIQNRRLCIVTESNVGPLYAQELKSILEPHCKKVIIHQFRAGEQYKNKFDRKDMLLALGGGVTGDMTGFTAATYLRGIDFVQLPTTLLAQVDSSIGGKTGVDFKAYKNMVGAFYMPKLVYMNLSTLNSLPQREYLQGMGEVIKHGIIRDKEYFNWLTEHVDDVIKKNLSVLKELLFVSCNIKRVVVENDPKEQNERALLNFGHTIGHAVEKAKNFSLLHGECISIGINAAAYLSMEKGILSEEEYFDIIKLLNLYQLPVTTSNILVDDVVDATLNDKKMDAGIIKFILTDKIGNAFISRDISKKDLIKSVEKVIIDE